MSAVEEAPPVGGGLDLPIEGVGLESGFLELRGWARAPGEIERVELWVEGVGRVPTRLVEGGAGEGVPFEAALVLPRALGHLRSDLVIHRRGLRVTMVELPTRLVVHRDARVTVRLPLASGARLLGALDEPAPDGRLEAGATSAVRGWVGVEGRRVERVWVEVDGARHYLTKGRARPDIAHNYPTIVDADRTGFVGTLTAPARGPHADVAMWAELDDGSRVRWMTRRAPVSEHATEPSPPDEDKPAWPRALLGWARERLGVAAADPERSEPPPPPSSDPEGVRARDVALERLLHANPLSVGLRARLTPLAAALKADGGPRIGLLMALSDASVARVRRCLRALREQLYEGWELWALDDGTSGPYLAGALAGDARVHRVVADLRGAKALNQLLSVATTEHVAVLDPDLLLPPDALLTLARAMSASAVDVLYGDEDRVDDTGRHSAPAFKPPFNLALALGADYLGRPTLIRRSLALQAGGYDATLEGAHEHDLLLRLLERDPAPRVRHVAHVLAHRREPERPPARRDDALTRCLTAALARRGYAARPVAMTQHRDGRRIVWSDAAPNATPVTIVIPTRDRIDLLEPCVDALKRTVDEAALRVVLVDDHSERPETAAYLAELAQDPRFDVVRPPGPRAGFNFSRLVNFGVARVETPLVLLLNNDCEALRPGWLAQMVGWASLDDVGVVGARLLYSDGRIQHAGVTIGVHGGLADHLLHGAPGDSDGYLGLARLSRDAAAATGACLLTRVDLFRRLGGLDEARLGVDYNDVDYCLRVIGAGRRVVYAAEAELRHLGSASRGLVVNPLEKGHFARAHAGFVDPHMNPAFDTESPRFVIDPHRALHTYAAPDRLRVLLVPEADDSDASSELHDLIEALVRRSDVALRVLRRPPPRLGGDPGEWRRSIERIAESTDPFDVVLALGAGAAHGVELARRRGRASVLHLPGREPFEVMAGLFGVGPASIEVFAQAVSNATRVVFSSPHVMESYEPLASDDRYRVLPVGVSIPRLEAFCRTHPRAAVRSRHGFGEHELVLLIAAEGQAAAVRHAIRDVAPRACVYRLAGSLARPLTAGRPVLAREEVLRITDVVLLADATPDVFPRVLLEAMALHLPVVGPWVPGIGDVVGPDVHGYMTNMRSASDVAAILAPLVEDERLRQRVGDHAAVQIRLLLDASRQVDKHVELLREAYVAAL